MPSKYSQWRPACHRPYPRCPVRTGRDYTGSIPDNMADPLVRRVLAAPEARSFVRWSTMPMAQVERGRCTARVSLGDARYGRTATDNRLGRVVTVPTGAAGC